MYFRPILLAVDLEFYKDDAFIVTLIKTLRDHFISEEPNPDLSKSLPDTLIKKIPKGAAELLKSTDNSEEINTTRFEFYVYDKMFHQLDRGRLFCNDSVSYCDLDYDLVPDALVDDAVAICEEYKTKNQKSHIWTPPWLQEKNPIVSKKRMGCSHIFGLYYG